MQAVKEKKRDRRTLDEIRTAGIRKNAKERQALKKQLIEERIQTNTSLPAYTDARLIAYRLADYFYKQDNTTINRDTGATAGYTETGLIVALGIDHTVFKAYAAGDRDYLTADIDSREGNHVQRFISDYKVREELAPYYMYLIGLNPHITADSDLVKETEERLLNSQPIQKARLLVSEQREQHLSDRGRVGDIFIMKARENWTDTGTNTASITIRRDDDIDTALKMLGFKQD